MISLKDEYFNRILDGTKLFEFRRIFAKNLEEPFLCIIYISSPIKAVRGIVCFDKPIKRSIQDLLELAKETNYPFIESVKRYFKGKKEGYALQVKEVKDFKKPLSLTKLQEVYANFKPPQSFYCLDNKQFIKLRDYINNHESYNESIFQTIWKNQKRNKSN